MHGIQKYSECEELNAAVFSNVLTCSAESSSYSHWCPDQRPEGGTNKQTNKKRGSITHEDMRAFDEHEKCLLCFYEWADVKMIHNSGGFKQCPCLYISL